MTILRIQDQWLNLQPGDWKFEDLHIFKKLSRSRHKADLWAKDFSMYSALKPARRVGFKAESFLAQNSANFKATAKQKFTARLKLAA